MERLLHPINCSRPNRGVMVGQSAVHELTLGPCVTTELHHGEVVVIHHPSDVGLCLRRDLGGKVELEAVYPLGLTHQANSVQDRNVVLESPSVESVRKIVDTPDAH